MAFISRALSVTLLAVLPAWSLAQSSAPAPLLQAVSNAPVLEAARKRIDAARSRTDAAGQLANPEVEAMASKVTRESREMYEVTVMQPLPKRGERAADRDRARAVVTMSEAEYAMTAAELSADVATALAEAEGADARVKVLEAQAGRLDSVLKSIEARLATATTARFADRLTVQTRIATMQLTIEEQRRAAADALAEARGRLGLTPEASLPPYAAPSVREISPADAPALSVASARVAEADAMAKMARVSAKPSTAVGLRFERERSRMGNEDIVGLAFSSEIPFRSRRYSRAEVKAAESDRAAAQADANGARYRITSALSRVERAERVTETARRLAAETRARLDAQYDSLVRSAGAGSATGGESTVLMAVEILEKVAETELKVIDADTAARTARAELWRYVSTARFLSPNN